MTGADEAVRALRAAGDGTRLRILAALSVRSLCVCELVSLVDVGQPAVSRHLGLLEAAGLVASVRDGRWIEYRLAGAGPRTFVGGLLRGIAALATIDAELIDVLRAARHADRRVLREQTRETCKPEPGGAAPSSERVEDSTLHPAVDRQDRTADVPRTRR
jgi:ArsR family transcriptional regulator